MSALVSVRKHESIAVITIDNPPVNALGQAVRAGIRDALAELHKDDLVAAIVLACAGRTFVAGADITEFGKPQVPPSLGEVIATLDGMNKPVVAALHGTALGGGLELALGCHYRIAAPQTRLGLPEIKLGIIPGAGGTQRLPRVTGMDAAMAMILSGDPVGAKKALASGLIDHIANGDVNTAAIEFAKEIATARPLPRISERKDKLAALQSDMTAFEAMAQPYLTKMRGQKAPQGAIEALRGALSLPFADGLTRERGIFEELVRGDQSKAQRHVFFAERAAAKIAGLPKDARAIERVAVIGAGTMGGGIAMAFANAGISVTIVDTSADALARGMANISRNYAASVTRGSLDAGKANEREAKIAGTLDIAAISEADLIVEAAFEDMDVKKEIFATLDGHAKKDAILATNTSYLDLDAIAESTSRPQSVLGLHFFSPANVMRLLEIVRAEKTSPDALAAALALARRIGKVPVVVGNAYGFVGNRMLRARAIESERLLLEGASPQQVDAALMAFGFPMGPFAMSDLAGLDISWRMRKAQGLRAEIADALCERGHFGQKTGRGFYRYEAGSRAPVADSDVAALIAQTSKRLGIARREIGDTEIIERLIYPMINEGARILDESIAQRPGDIDVVWVYGYGFPAWRGGPMFYADQIGLGEVAKRLDELAAHTKDERHKPSALLCRLADAGQTFGSLPQG